MPHHPATSPVSLVSRRDPTVAAIAREWRALTSGRSRRGGRRLGPGQRTLIACSGGADSSALAIALAAVSRDLVIAHILHDMRPAHEAAADRDAVRELASRLDLPFVEASISVHPPLLPLTPLHPSTPSIATPHATPSPNSRNIEHLARVRRYAALTRLAQECGAGFVATAHHAQDQLETLLMRIIRGTGPRGLRGIARRRSLTPPHPPPPDPPPDPPSRVILVRPMLTVSRADAERLCAAAGWHWRDDATNHDESRVRSAIRRRVVPALLALEPHADRHAATTALLLHELSAVADRAARRLHVAASPPPLIPSPSTSSPQLDPLVWSRAALRSEPAVILGVLLRRHLRALRPGASHRGGGFGIIRQITRAIRDDSTDPRSFTALGVQIDVTAHAVSLRKAPP